MTFGIEAVVTVGWGAGCSAEDSDRRLFGRRYRSGDGLTGEDRVGGEKVEDGVMIVELGLAVPETTRAVPTIVESSLVPDLWLIEERSEEEDDDVVETEGFAG
jgi:hypothetical protein